MESDQETDPGPSGAEISPLNTRKVNKSSLTKPLFFILIFHFIFPGANSRISPANFDEFYPKHCSQIVQQSPPLETASPELVQSLNGYFSASASKNPISGASFQPARAFKTKIQGLLKVRGTLVLMDPNALVSKNVGNSTNRRTLRTFRVRGPRIPVRHDRARFRLYGYWSTESGKVCMVGSALFYANGGNLRSYDAVFKLNFPVKSNINDSLITGNLESLDGSDALNDQFESMSLLGLNKNSNYEYTLIEKENGRGSFSEYRDGGSEENLSLEKIKQDICTAFRWNSALELDYSSGCNASSNCNPFGGNVAFLPKVLLLTRVQCSTQGKMQILMKFRNASNFYYNVDYYGFDPSITLIGEGEWDRTENRLCAVVCRFLNFAESLANAFVGDCSVRLCLRFPATLSIKSRSPLLGQIWSTKSVSDSEYFTKIGLQGSGKVLPGMKYEYSMVEHSKSSCVKSKTAKRKGKSYPSSSSRDMSFDFSVKDTKGHIARGYSTPIFVGDQAYDFSLFGLRYFDVKNQTESSVIPNSLQNVSYTMSFTIPADFKAGGSNADFSPNKTVEIFAEGTYDQETGLLCLVGCRRLSENNSFDCAIQINVEYPPLKGKTGEKIKGSIQTSRSRLDPHYFDRLELSSSSIYIGIVKQSIWRMDLEIVMVLVSNSLTCIFLGLQLYHIKKHPEVLPFISIVMLTVLTLGLMIPLLLNFEALFAEKSNRPNYILGAGEGWLEVNEVIVRVVTMVAFLLQLRLLQLNWSARQEAGSQKGLIWASDRKVLCASLPVYITGGLIAWLVFLWNNSHSNPFSSSRLSLWGHFKSYAGLVLDGFLLPQILFNMFFDSREKALASSFYIGTTVVRLLPHAYDLFRTHISTWYPGISYIYANHKMDFYSTAWDIIIPCGGLVFAVIIFLQQRFSGRFVLPRRFRGSSDAYEKVSSIEL